MADTDRLERLADLILVLLQTPTPLPLSQIASALPGYPAEAGDARRQAFERDKRLLREEGIELLVEPIGGEEQVGYRIDPERYYLPDLELTADEHAALTLAVAAVSLGGTSAASALAKLGAVAPRDGNPLADLPPEPALPVLFDATRLGVGVHFLYRGVDRQVVPFELRFWQGHWYVNGFDLERDAMRLFRLDRMESQPSLTEQRRSALDIGDAVDRSVELDPVQAALVDDGVDPDLVLDLDHIGVLRVAAVAGDEVIELDEDGGGGRARLSITNARSARSWILSLGAHATVLEPTALRDEVVSWLNATLLATAPPHASSALLVASNDGGSSRPSAANRLDARARLRRLFAMLTWLAQVSEASIDEIATRFSLAPDDVVAELELAACCGAPPFTPDALLDIYIDGEIVHAALPASMARPRRLTPAEGFALSAAARTILATSGVEEGGPLERALGKLDNVLGTAPIVVDVDAPGWLEVVRSAVESQSQLQITYHSSSRDELSERIVDPQRIVMTSGHFYLQAYCHVAQATRDFRVDRIASAVVLGPQGELVAIAPDDAPGVYVPDGDAELVTLWVADEGRWILDAVPTVASAAIEGGVVVQLAVSGLAWFSSMLLQLGPAAAVVEPTAFKSLGREAASDVLGRYQAKF